MAKTRNAAWCSLIAFATACAGGTGGSVGGTDTEASTMTGSGGDDVSATNPNAGHLDTASSSGTNTSATAGAQNGTPSTTMNPESGAMDDDETDSPATGAAGSTTQGSAGSRALDETDADGGETGDSPAAGGTEPVGSGEAGVAQGGAGGAGEGSAGTMNEPVVLPTPSWTTDMLPFFEQSCGAGNTGCHAKEVFAGQANSNCRGWLSLANESIGGTYFGEYMNGQATGCPDVPLHDRLLSESWQCNDLPYVAPGDPENSYLYRKIAGGPYCDNGDVPSDPMPQVGSLSDEQIDMVRRWIEAGAPTDG